MPDEPSQQTPPADPPAGGPPAGAPSGATADPKVLGLLAYLAGWITGIILYLVSKDKFVRFHAVQSIVVFGAFTVLQIILGFTLVLAILVPIVWIVEIILWVFLMVKAYQGQRYKLPIAGNLAEKYA